MAEDWRPIAELEYPVLWKFKHSFSGGIVDVPIAVDLSFTNGDLGRAYSLSLIWWANCMAPLLSSGCRLEMVQTEVLGAPGVGRTDVPPLMHGINFGGDTGHGPTASFSLLAGPPGRHTKRTLWMAGCPSSFVSGGKLTGGGADALLTGARVLLLAGGAGLLPSNQRLLIHHNGDPHGRGGTPRVPSYKQVTHIRTNLWCDKGPWSI